jgi:hypothetical protein
LEEALAKVANTWKNHVKSSNAIFQSLSNIIMILEKFYKKKTLIQAKEPMRSKLKSILSNGIGQGNDTQHDKEK